MLTAEACFACKKTLQQGQSPKYTLPGSLLFSNKSSTFPALTSVTVDARLKYTGIMINQNAALLPSEKPQSISLTWKTYRVSNQEVLFYGQSARALDSTYPQFQVRLVGMIKGADNFCRRFLERTDYHSLNEINGTLQTHKTLFALLNVHTHDNFCL